jgi:hypothetical protein
MMSSIISKVKSLPMYSYMNVRRFSAGKELLVALSLVIMKTSEMKLCIFYSLVSPLPD